MINGAPVYKKIELIRKAGDSQIKEEYENCGFVITGDHAIVIEKEISEKNNLVTATGQIIPIGEIIKYRTIDTIE